MNSINMNRDIPRVKRNENVLKQFRKIEEDKENYIMGGLVIDYFSKKKTDSKSKERQFGKEITNFILNHTNQIQRSTAGNSSDNRKSIMFPPVKKLQTNPTNIPNVKERATSKNSIEKNGSSNYNNETSNKNKSKIIASVKYDKSKSKQNSVRNIKIVDSSGNIISKFNEPEKNRNFNSLERKNKIGSLDLKPVSSVKNLVKIPSHRPHNISLKYNYSTLNINSALIKKNPSNSKTNIPFFNYEENSDTIKINRENENKENVDFNRAEKEIISIPTGSTVESYSTEITNIQTKYSASQNNLYPPKEEYITSKENNIKSDRNSNANEIGIKAKHLALQRLKQNFNNVVIQKPSEIKEKEGKINIFSLDKTISSIPKKNIQPIINFNNFIKTSETSEDPLGSLNDKPIIYIDDIYLSLKEEEKVICKTIDEDYLQIQTDVNEQMRGILIDWIIEVNLKFKLREETLFLTVNLIDRFLSKNIINRSKLQLLGVASMFIACKFEEIYTPHIKDFVYITDNAYSIKDILDMEVQILNTIKYNVLAPTPLQFFELIAKFFNFNHKEFLFGRYLIESFLIDYKSIKYLPSLIACTAAYITMKFFKHKNYQAIYHGIFSPNIVLLKDCAKKICYLVDNLQNSNLNSVKKKFSRKEYLQVACMNFS